MVQIDDAGSGSLIGGTCIGILKTDTNKYYYEIIPIKYYNKTNFSKKKYLDYVIEIVKRGFIYLDVTPNDKIEVCRGYMFDKLRKWFKQEGYDFTNVKITGLLQDTIEKTFEDYTISLGLPEYFIKYTKYPFHFHKLLRWVYADYNRRKLLCKIGWKSWTKYGNLPLDITYEIMPQKHYTCLKCGKTLKPGVKVKVIRYKSNMPNIIYLHKACRSYH